jgi:glycolate oxidase FAD binding subunit
VLRPTSEAELSEAVRAATGPLAVRGGGTRGGGGGPSEVLSTAGLAGVRLYEPGALTLVAAAGTPLAEVEALLAAEGQRLAFEPPDLRALLNTAGASTRGGVVAANASGPRRVQSGAARDFLLGVRFVDGEGTAIASGGRVMKNVTGYDLVKLAAGSRGALGVISEVSLKVLPAPEAAATLVLPAADAGTGMRVLAAALGSPFDVSGAAWWPGRGALVRVEGFAASVAYRAGRLEAALAGFGAAERLDTPGSDALWREVRDVAPLAGRPGAVWRLSVKPSDAPAALDRLAPEAALVDWGGGLVWALVVEGTDVRARLDGIGGHATRLRGAGPGPALPPEAPAVAALAAGLRARFDPRALFAPAG